jgi:ABC-type nitrate/sulfonate/bicarbonate transport system substrate-binding protein
MKRRSIGWSVVILVLPFVFTLSLAAQERSSKVRITYPSNSLAMLPLFAAVKWKIFEQNGLQVEIIQARSQIANPALASGEVQYVGGVGPSSVAASLSGMPARAVWFASDQLIYSLIARPEFRTLKDLRKKKIGLTGLGGTSQVSLQIALEAAGEDPKDFVYLPLGGAEMLTALEAGSIDAAMLSPPLLFYAKKKGFNEILDIGARVKMPLGGLTTLISTIQGRPGEVRRVIRALQSTKQEILRSREKTAALIASLLRVDRETAEATYAAYGKTVSGNGIPTTEGMNLIVKALESAGRPPDRRVKFEEIADDSIAKEVAKDLGYKVN